MKNYKLFLSVCLLMLANFKVQAQSTNATLETEQYHLIDRIDVLHPQTKPLHSGFKPYFREDIVNTATEINTDSLGKKAQANLAYLYATNQEFAPKDIATRKPLLKHFYQYPADFYTLQTEDFWLKINPIVYFAYLYQKNNDNNLFINTRGLELRGAIGNKLGFYASLTENQAHYPSFLTQQIYGDNIPSNVALSYLPAVPGVGYFRNFKGTGVDYFTADGYVSFQAMKQINVQFGHGKHFIGNGLRSLILSNNSANALYLRMQAKVWKFQYTALFEQLVNQFENNYDTYRSPKYLALHHLSYNIRENLNLSFFESVVFGRENGFDLNYLNPLIFYRSLERDLGSPDNVMVGMDMKWNVLKHVSLYGQLVLDEWHFDGIKQMNGDWRNKFGVQMGAKYYDIARIKTLDLQVEYNWVRPYLYSHNSAGNSNAPNSPTANYAHYNQPLAHPLGANFSELMLLLRYQPHPKIIVEWRTQYAQKGLNALSSDGEVVNYGGDIFRNYADYLQLTGNTVAQGIAQKIINSEMALTWWFKPNLHFDFTLQARNETINNQKNNTLFVGLNTRWNIGRKQFYF